MPWSVSLFHFRSLEHKQRAMTNKRKVPTEPSQISSRGDKIVVCAIKPTQEDDSNELSDSKGQGLALEQWHRDDG